MTAIAPPVPRTDSRTLRVTGLLVRRQALVWAWYWGLLALVAVMLSGIPTLPDDAATGVWGFLDTAPRWFAFAMLVGLLLGSVGPHVALGMTRRGFTGVLAVVAGLTALVGAVIWTLGAVVEARLTGRTVGAVGPIVLENAAQLASYAAAGVLVGAVYYRAGGWWGTVTLPLTLGPTVLAETWVATGWQGATGAALGLPPAPPVLTYLLPALVAVLLLLAARPVLGGAAIRRPSG